MKPETPTTEAKHTPGPWEESQGTYDVPNNPVSTNSTHYVRIFHYSGPNRRVIDDVFGYGIDEARANAALIAAAPETAKERDELKAEVERLRQASFVDAAIHTSDLNELKAINAKLLGALEIAMPYVKAWSIRNENPLVSDTTEKNIDKIESAIASAKQQNQK